jgi:tetratricopeptide (TPR) repeat protein/tRNA A-37 threonylcarbamoyl transferase component Bud32
MSGNSPLSSEPNDAVSGTSGSSEIRPTHRDDPSKRPADRTEVPAPTATVNYRVGAARAAETVGYSVNLPAQSDTPGEGAVVPGYEILGVLGRGAMGVVYKARHVKLNRLVALKMILTGAHAGASELARFHTEAEAVARIQHPNIVQIYEVGEHNSLPFFSLEYINGGSLLQKISGKPQPPREAAHMVELLARAMAVAHERGIIHRDLKPGNVLLILDGTPKIADFGLAKRLEDDSALTKAGTLMGTPSYMSPEQARGDITEIGPLADLYSLGAILYELLTGRPPFNGPTILDTLAQVRNEEPVPPTRLQPKCPRDLETIALKCLQKEPAKRYANCEGLADDLKRFLNGEPIKARPVSTTERAWRWCRRNPRVAALSTLAAILLLVVAATLVNTVMGARQERQAVAQTRKIAAERLEQATAAIAGGDSRRAQDLLLWSDPLLKRHLDLAALRSDLETLQTQVNVFAEFRELLDRARFACRFGTHQQKQESRSYCHKLLGLYDEIEGRRGKGAAGLPPLNAEQQQLFKEDVFEGFLTAAQVEQELSRGGGDAAQRRAAHQALDWLNQADQVLPGTKALHVHRAICWTTLGNVEAANLDMDQAKAITPATAVDHFWHGFAHHLRGDQARRAKDFKAANDFYRQELGEYAICLQFRPDHFWGYFNWANCHVQLNELPDLYDALVGYTSCIRLQPEFPWSYNNCGTVHLRLKEPNLALADFNLALERNEEYAEAHANRGLAHMALSQTDAALRDFSRAIELNPDYIPAYTERVEIYRKRNQHAEAVRDCTRLLELGADKAQLYEKRAAAYRALNQAEDARQDIERLIELNPKNLQARAAHADLLLAMGRYAEVRDEYSAILKAAPKAVAIWRARGIVNWQKLKDFDAALVDFEEWARLAPNEAEAHRCIGAIQLGRRQYGPALAALQKAIDQRPGYPEAIWAQAFIYLRQGKLEQALKELDPLVAKLPDCPPETLNVRGDVYLAQGRLPEAAADFRRMTELKPKEPEAYVCLARVYEKQGEPAKAAECFDRLVTATPESAWAYLRRAEYRRNRGEYEAALADCEKAARLKPDSVLPALVRASVKAASGQASSAVPEAEGALAKAPKDDGHVLYLAACVWSLASRATGDPAESNRLADRATAFLAAALDKGFYDLLFPEHNRLAEDPALAPIRQLPRVRDLLAVRS